MAFTWSDAALPSEAKSLGRPRVVGSQGGDQEKRYGFRQVLGEKGARFTGSWDLRERRGRCQVGGSPVGRRGRSRTPGTRRVAVPGSTRSSRSGAVPEAIAGRADLVRAEGAPIAPHAVDGDPLVGRRDRHPAAFQRAADGSRRLPHRLARA